MSEEERRKGPVPRVTEPLWARVTPECKASVAQLAAQYGVSTSQVVRWALDEGLAALKKQRARAS